MYWRVPRAKYEEGKGETNRRAFQRLVRKGPAPGVLGYMDGTPAGWCAVGPRESFPTLDRSRTLKPIDDRPVWAVTCFVTRTGFRRRGISRALAHAAADFARRRGARAVEGYPMITEPGHEVMSVELHVGSRDIFVAAGYVEVSHPTARRVVMRIDF